MDSLSCAIALFNIVATTLEFSSVSRSSDGRHHISLNIYNMVIARSSFGKGNITNLIRNVLHSICGANDQSMNLRLDEFTRAGLMNCLDKSTKIFMADEADVAFVDAGLFSSFPKHSAENNCRWKIDHDFAERIEEIFQESFHKQTRVDKQLRQFFISDQVVVRAIDLVSGLVQQMKILLDGTNAPIWAASQARSLIVLSINDDRSFDTEKHEKKEKKKILVSHYVSTEKLQRIAMETVLYPSLCFTATQLHMNSLLHNAASSKIRCILEHLMKCDLLECVNKGVKTSRRFTNVCIQRLPICDHDEQMNTDYRSIFDEKLKEFKYSHSTFTLDEYFKKSMINIHVTGAVTDELIKFFSLPEYMMVELRPLYNLEETKNLKSTSAIQSHVNIQSNLVDNNVVLYNGNYQCNHHTTTDCSTLMTLHDDNDVSCIFDEDIE
ncbi:unnamed protein product [Rotaria magnacalcarata]|uniref:Uncharacterized protein n=1 Tax=Rotaria magnacalcarata TaxID=392030 RepID=A0A8S2R951_9BILA|nr:unnamed protein product [Rotaria magnacalcarata]